VRPGQRRTPEGLSPAPDVSKMPTLLFIDHSLKDVGGHHYEGALRVLRAAETRGLGVVLATHRRFRPPPDFPRSWRVLPAFADDTYSKYAVRPGGYRPYPVLDWWSTEPAHSVLEAMRQRWNLHGLQRLRRRFARDLGRVLDATRPGPEDHVFVTTVSDVDLLGIGDALAARSPSQGPTWHLQFHYALIEGRPPEYEEQRARQTRLTEHFGRCLERMRGHRVRLHATTRELVAQLERLGVAPFELLPFPADPTPADPDPEGDHVERRLRITCAGDVRGEKGQRHLAPIVRGLWQEGFASGRLQLLLQSGRPRLELAAGSASDPPLPVGEWPLPRPEPIVRVPHPLPAEEFARLIAATDVGLLLHDAEAYYARCSGILVDMLIAGVPVVVPAGCWLSEQISEAGHLHLEQLRENLTPLSQLGARDLGLSADVGADETVRIGADGRQTALDLPAGARETWLGWRWREPIRPGTWLRIHVHSFDADGRPVDDFATAVGHRREPTARATALVHLGEGARRIEVSFSNAFSEKGIVIDRLEVALLGQPGARDGAIRGLAGGGCVPAGAVGLVAADVGQVPALLRDLCTHYDHYQRTAAAFALGYRADHDPARVLALLLGEPGAREASGTR